MLVPDYYSIKEQYKEADSFVFCVALNPACQVYEGHFPGSPVSPGVCNIQMIKECIELATGKELFMNYIQQCRLTTLITPQTHPELNIRIQILSETAEQVKVRALIESNDETHMDLKAEGNIL